MKNSAVGREWKDVREILFTPEEITDSNRRVAALSKSIIARKEQRNDQNDQEDDIISDRSGSARTE